MYYQLKSILWKNWLLKKAHFSGFLAELFLPVLFMTLLIFIKSITTAYDSPNIAYYCGNAYPWYYSSVSHYPLTQQIPMTCTQKPQSCDTSHYYQDKVTTEYNNQEFSWYTQYGYTPSSASSGTSTNPFYTFTVGDTSSIYDNYGNGIDNPSLSLCNVIYFVSKTYPRRAVIALAPADDDASAAIHAQNFKTYLYSRCGMYSQSLQYFTSESALNNYMTDSHYDDVGYGYGKVAFAVVFNEAESALAQWDYSIRANYTSMFDTADKTVACMYGGSGCDFTYTVPSTKYYTSDLYKPQQTDGMYGYSFSGFSTLQQAVDAYIFLYTAYITVEKENGVTAKELDTPAFNNRFLEHVQKHVLPDGSPPTVHVESSDAVGLEEPAVHHVGSKGATIDIRASISMMPTPPYKTDDFQYIISSTLGIFYMLSFLYPVSRIVRSLVLDKETRIKEGMKMMGLSDTAYNLSWLITTVLQMTFVSILITLVTASSVFQYSDKFYVFVYFEAFSLSVVGMCFLMATLFSRAKAASLLGPMIFFASFFPYYAVNDPQFDSGSKTATCILAPACFALGANVFADYEGGLVGVRSSNAGQETSNFTYNACVGMMFFDAVLYGVLAWYLDKVFPSEFGTQLPYHFPLLPSYWFGVKMCDASGKNRKDNFFTRAMVAIGLASSRSYSHVSVYEEDEERAAQRVSLERGLLGTETDSEVYSQSASMNRDYFEAVTAELRQQLTDEKCLSIRNLRRVFKNTAGGDDRVAVAGLNLDLFQGQVTVLLGHNGAGKTTTISMLVGLIPPTSGDAALPGGLRISEDMQAIRRNLGVCPQHDILFPELTAMQHLQIYAAFKGMVSSEVDAEARRMLAEVGLAEKANARSSTLSGGQKRKLSLGIALIGDSKVVILDEPTSGMDPYSRRSTWNIIQRNKKGRVILLTTHFMDEADLLGDRVAIMAHGKLQCVGGPMFLKSQFGVGYTLTVVKTAQTNQNAEQLAFVSEHITELVKRFVPVGELLSDVGAEQSFRLPFSASDRFVDLFQALDKNQRHLNIAEYGISVTTLEEVFIRVGELENSDEAAKKTDRVEEEVEEVVAPFAVTTSPIRSPIHLDSARSGLISSETSMSSVFAQEDDQDEESVSLHSVNEMYNVSLGSSFALPKGGKAAVVQQMSSPVRVVSSRKHQPPPDDIDRGPMFWRHFSALFIKRAIYGKRDRRMMCCQLALPVLLLVVGLTILLIQPDLNQPDLILSPNKYNTGLSPEFRNFVAFNVEKPTPVGERLMSRFNGATDGDGVQGVAVPLADGAYNDSFASCSQGAIPLHTTSNFLLQPAPRTEKGSSRYGSVTVANTTDASHLHYNVMVNGSALHGAGLYVNQVHTAYLQVLSAVSNAQIVTHNYPLPRTVRQDGQMATASAFIVSLFAMIAFCFVPASFAVFVVKEREVKAKHQQIISGASIYAYWCSTFLWDILSYLPTALLVIALLYAYDIKAYTTGPAASATFMLFLLNGPATAALTYLISYLFASHSTAQIVVMFFNFLTGLCLMVVSFVLTNVPSTSETELTLRYVFRLFPSFCLGDGLAQLALCTDGSKCPLISGTGYDFNGTQGPLSWDITGGNLVFLGAETVVYFLLVLMIEYGLTFPSLLSWLYQVRDEGCVSDENEDEDVQKERSRVASGRADGDVVRIDSLRKVYPVNGRAGGLNLFSWCWPQTSSAPKSKVAVQNLSFGIPKGECFGFLGINGAGKTTTLSILSGEFPPTSGSAFIDGYSIQEDQSKIRRHIGYCPQFDALLELLTVREHLQLYARIKGLTGTQLEEVVVRKMTQLDLLDFENKTAGSLSGGNKRKLSVAVATIGDPSILFLDEPSTGMDPVARRFMWDVIAKMSTQGGQCSVILTTHSMEEAEALCTRIGVMVNGRLCCLGSGQHLKHRFGNGFEVNIRTSLPAAELVMSLSQRLTDRHAIQQAAPTNTNPISTFLVKSDISDGLESGLHVERLEDTLIRPTDLGNVCVALNNAQREQSIAPFKSGALIREMLDSDGSVTVRSFLEWWVAEDVADTLNHFMNAEFQGRAALLERSTSQNFRYRIRLEEEPSNQSNINKNIQGLTGSSAASQTHSALSEVFAKFEANKSALCVQEYSVGQTTLEQIFNQFAAHQDNPEVAAILANSATTDSQRTLSKSNTGR